VAGVRDGRGDVETTTNDGLMMKKMTTKRGLIDKEVE